MPDISELLQKEMTRKQFLMWVGVGVLSMFSLPSLLGKIMAKPQVSSPKPTRSLYGTRD